MALESKMPPDDALKAAIHQLFFNDDGSTDFLYNYEVEPDPHDLACTSEEVDRLKRFNVERLRHDEELLAALILRREREAKIDMLRLALRVAGSASTWREFGVEIKAEIAKLEAANAKTD